MKEGAKVKVTIMFRGREMAHRDLGFRMMEKLADEVSEVGMVETRPKIEGPRFSTIISAKKAPGKGSTPQPSRPAGDDFPGAGSGPSAQAGCGAGSRYACTACSRCFGGGRACAIGVGPQAPF